ncbi:cysteine hydrolase family protein [Butyrivibrio sp. YAB3001]|uniref:cysteine hydrolase family protein n=1 Tax=Butyrivibrio sp. YAB3001 TaxID=1520812 RepID=UPI0008F64FD3|nr:isochorismatase family cysteine hydrolase [Butyrivibrio sp. YAB3001]SFB83840.1 Nicotinamidase-related amidase [Butyrivibrio sp. YAB3001]
MDKVLVVVDMQNDFVTGALGSKEAKEIVPNVVEKVKNFDGKVIFTRDTHHDNYMETQEGKNLPVPHCFEGTEGWEIIPELTEFTKGATIYNKPTFGSTELAEFIKKEAEENDGELQVELIGVCTDICVVSNALLIKAFCREIPVSVDAKCCAGVTPSAHEAALTTMKSCQVQVV